MDPARWQRWIVMGTHVAENRQGQLLYYATVGTHAPTLGAGDPRTDSLNRMRLEATSQAHAPTWARAILTSCNSSPDSGSSSAGLVNQRNGT